MSPDVEARFQRIEVLLQQTAETQAQTARRLDEMAARQQYHDEAFDRMDASVKANNAEIAKLDSHMIKLTKTMDRLANIVIRHEERLDEIQGEQ